MKNINYKTLDDYEKLFNLIKQGLEVVCFLQEDDEYIKIGYAKSEESELYENKLILSVGSQGAGYINTYDNDAFIESCKAYNLKFIEPYFF